MIGRTLSHYRITGQIGAGGMGIVYAAEDSRLGREVALKFVSSDFAHDEQAVARLRSEAKAASALNHPNICTIYDIGEEQGHPFIVMELMKGQSLRERLNSGPLKLLQVIDLGSEIADALHVAHTVGIIHRDIKPGNIFITERGLVKILDFGLAKLTQTLTTSTTGVSGHTSATGVAHGTPAYMSPEQATGELLDGRTDLFSLGVVMYESVTGHHPFPGKTPAVVLAGILDRAPVSPLVHNPELPPRLVEIISNCLEKDRELRYQSAADLRADLRRLRRDLDSSSVRAFERSTQWSPSSRETPRAFATGSTAHDAGVDRQSTPVAVSRHRAVWVLAAVVLLGAIVALGLWMPSRPGDVPVAGPGPVPAAPAAASDPAASTPPAAATSPAARQVALATASMDAGNYRAALVSAREALALDPNNATAAKIRDQATAMLERFDNEIADVRRRLGGGDLEGAARALDRARAIDSASPAILELSARLSTAFRAREQTARATTQPPTSVPAQTAPPAPPAAAPPAVTPPVVTSVVPAPPAPRPAEIPAARPEPPPAPREPAPAPVERTPNPPPRNDEQEDAAIRQVIANYGRAIEAKDLRLFRSIKPNLTPEEERRLQEGFRAVTSQRVNLTILSIDRTDNRATAQIRRRDEIVAGGRRQTTEAQQILSFVRAASGWVIVDIR